MHYHFAVNQNAPCQHCGLIAFNRGRLLTITGVARAPFDMHIACIEYVSTGHGGSICALSLSTWFSVTMGASGDRFVDAMDILTELFPLRFLTAPSSAVIAIANPSTLDEKKDDAPLPITVSGWTLGREGLCTMCQGPLRDRPHVTVVRVATAAFHRKCLEDLCTVPGSLKTMSVDGWRARLALAFDRADVAAAALDRELAALFPRHEILDDARRREPPLGTFAPSFSVRSGRILGSCEVCGTGNWGAQCVVVADDTDRLFFHHCCLEQLEASAPGECRALLSRACGEAFGASKLDAVVEVIGTYVSCVRRSSAPPPPVASKCSDPRATVSGGDHLPDAKRTTDETPRAKQPASVVESPSAFDLCPFVKVKAPDATKPSPLIARSATPEMFVSDWTTFTWCACHVCSHEVLPTDVVTRFRGDGSAATLHQSCMRQICGGHRLRAEAFLGWCEREFPNDINLHGAADVVARLFPDELVLSTPDVKGSDVRHYRFGRFNASCGRLSAHCNFCNANAFVDGISLRNADGWLFAAHDLCFEKHVAGKDAVAETRSLFRTAFGAGACEPALTALCAVLRREPLSVRHWFSLGRVLPKQPAAVPTAPDVVPASASEDSSELSELRRAMAKLEARLDASDRARPQVNAPAQTH